MAAREGHEGRGVVRHNPHGWDHLVGAAVQRNQRERPRCLRRIVVLVRAWGVRGCFAARCLWHGPIRSDVEVANPVPQEVIVPLDDVVADCVGAGRRPLEADELVLLIEFPSRLATVCTPCQDKF